MMSRANKKYNSIMFGRFAQEFGLTTDEVAQLCNLANDAAYAEELAISENIPGLRKKADIAVNEFEVLAQTHGFGVSWPGLFPLLRRDGRDVYLPL